MVFGKIKNSLIFAILEKDFKSIEKRIKLVETNLKNIQIDICDGILTNQKTFGSDLNIEDFLKIEEIKKKYNLNIEFDFICKFDSLKKIEKLLEIIKTLNPNKIILHNKGLPKNINLFQKINEIENLKTEISLGIWQDDKVNSIKNIIKINELKFIQIMGIKKVGYSSQTLNPKIIHFLKEYKKDNVLISVDGGVKINNSKLLLENGVTFLISGTGIYKTKNIEKRIKDFEELF